MKKIKQIILFSVLFFVFFIIVFFYWKDQQAIKELNKSFPEGVKIERGLIGNYKIKNKLNNYNFKTPNAWKGIEEVKYLTERESKGYKFSSINIKGTTPKDGVVAIVKFESKPGIDLITQARLFFKAFNLNDDFFKGKVNNIDVVISKNNLRLMGIDAICFQKDNYSYLITCGSEDFIKEIINKGKW